MNALPPEYQFKEEDDVNDYTEPFSFSVPVGSKLPIFLYEVENHSYRSFSVTFPPKSLPFLKTGKNAGTGMPRML